MARQSVRETFARHDMRPDFGHHRPQPAKLLVGGEQFQPVIDPRTGAQQQREVAGEDRDILGLRLAEQAENAACGISALFQRNIVDEDETEAFDPLRDIARRGCGNRTGDQFATAVERTISIARHRLTEPL